MTISPPFAATSKPPFTTTRKRMKYQFNDGGRAAAGFKGSTRDCVVRAVAIATEQPYLQVYNALADGNAGERRMKKSTGGVRSASHGINTRRQWFKEYMKRLGWKWTATMGIGTGCKVHLNANELPTGRIIAAVSKHYTAVIDGVINDTHDPSDRGTTIYSPNTPPDQMPKGVYWLENGNGWAYSPERCVYGYWSKA